jgi:hypothetical protein
MYTLIPPAQSKLNANFFSPAIRYGTQGGPIRGGANQPPTNQQRADPAESGRTSLVELGAFVLKDSYPLRAFFLELPPIFTYFPFLAPLTAHVSKVTLWFPLKHNTDPPTRRVPPFIFYFIF